MATLRAPRKIEQNVAENENWGASAPPPATIFREPEQEPQSDVDRVMSLIQSSGGLGRAVVKVSKVIEGVSTHCQSYTPSEFEEGDFDMLRDSFGAGRFKIMLYGEHPETGNFGLLTRSEVTIAENRNAKRQNEPQASQMDQGMSQVLKSIADGQAQMLHALIEIKQAPPVDPMAQMTQMLSMMTMMRSAMGLDGQQSTKTPISEIVAAVRELRGVAEELSPNEKPPEDSMLSMLPRVLDVIQTGMAQQNQAPQALQPPQALQSPPAPLQSVTIPSSLQETPAPPAPITLEPENMNLIEMMNLKMNLKTLIDMAVAKSSVANGAQLIYDNLPDDMVEVMAQDNWMAMLSVIDSGIAQHAEWFTEVRNAALAMFDPAPDADTLPSESAV